VRLGSPENQFGGPPADFWAAINGRYTEIQQGDPYASQCVTHSDTPEVCDTYTSDGSYREGGYYYGIEVAPGSANLSVELFDGGHYAEPAPPPEPPSPPPTPPPTPPPPPTFAEGTSVTGDTSWRWNWPEGQRGVYLEYNLFAPDSTPTDPTDNSDLRCSGIFAVNDDIGDGHFNTWDGPNNCDVNENVTEGVWILQFPSPLYEGSTKFGIRANVVTGAKPKVYGILDMSIYVNFLDGDAEPYLAEIRPEHGGKTFEIDIWDLGDNDGPAEIRFIDPVGGSADPPACSWTSTSSKSPSSDGTIGDCIIDISKQRFNAEWLRVSIPIADDPCNGALGDLACWWKVHIETSATPDETGQAHDRTTWTARVSGDPVRLVD
ncbi:MAG: hypothetical protein ACRDZM_00665, partial [Acidimicrobiia bacterium]